MKTNELIKIVESAGWQIERQKGSHIQFKHPANKGTVTLYLIMAIKMFQNGLRV